MIRKSVLACAVSAFAAATASAAAQRAVLLISVDGLRPDYVTRAGAHGLEIPRLRALMKDGVIARVRGVLPTVTYSSHTSIVTGVAPAAHGIYTNRPFDPSGRNTSIWYWYAQEIRVPTLWHAAAQAGYVTGSVSWPVTVGADAIRYNVPEYARTRDADDLKMVRGLTTPRLFAELEKKAGPYTTDVNQAIPRDWARTRWAAEMIRGKQIRFMTVHLASTDHAQHESGPFTPHAFEAIEEVDKMIGVLRDAILSVDPAAAVCIVSDHGFAKVDQRLKLESAFVQAGLITLKSRKGTVQASGVADWIAMPWESGGSTAVVLRNPNDEAARARVAQLLRDLASKPENGIAAILDRKTIAKLGGAPAADFWVDLRPGFAFSPSLSEPLVEKIAARGTHGYSPEHADLASTFLLAGKGIRAGVDLGQIEMRSIAPTIANLMGVEMPAAQVPPVAVSQSR